MIKQGFQSTSDTLTTKIDEMHAHKKRKIPHNHKKENKEHNLRIDCFPKYLLTNSMYCLPCVWRLGRPCARKSETRFCAIFVTTLLVANSEGNICDAAHNFSRIASKSGGPKVRTCRTPTESDVCGRRTFSATLYGRPRSPYAPYHRRYTRMHAPQIRRYLHQTYLLPPQHLGGLAASSTSACDPCLFAR